ncbi:MAG TPA: hypothetical protein VEJ63_14365 [Planctomycetota bacterium]|nr:hypothetical protein [Planctomycetota bacterium]
MSAIAAFLKQLYENGRVRVSILPDQSPAEQRATAEALQDLDAIARADFPGGAPLYDASAALWAAETFYKACQFLIYREIGAETVRKTLELPCPGKLSAPVCYSVDLSFRYLPDLVSLARGISEKDPLVEGLMKLAAAWPLSSVGVANVAEVDIDAFISDDCLRCVYADRIVQKRDASRLKDPRALAAVAEVLGDQRELCPELFDIIKAPAETA